MEWWGPRLAMWTSMPAQTTHHTLFTMLLIAIQGAASGRCWIGQAAIAYKRGAARTITVHGIFMMNIVIRGTLCVFLLVSGCQIVTGACDPEDLLPYSKKELIYEPSCSNKCCEFVVEKDAKICHEMWCFGNCSWTMTHDACY